MIFQSNHMIIRIRWCLTPESVLEVQSFKARCTVGWLHIPAMATESSNVSTPSLYQPLIHWMIHSFARATPGAITRCVYEFPWYTTTLHMLPSGMGSATWVVQRPGLPKNQHVQLIFGPQPFKVVKPCPKTHSNKFQHHWAIIRATSLGHYPGTHCGYPVSWVEQPG